MKDGKEKRDVWITRIGRGKMPCERPTKTMDHDRSRMRGCGTMRNGARNGSVSWPSYQCIRPLCAWIDEELPGAGGQELVPGNGSHYELGGVRVGMEEA